jgi:prenyltransferase beta subunit
MLSRSRASYVARGSACRALARCMPCMAICLCATVVAPVAGARAEGEGQLDASVRYLQEVQNPDGGFGGAPGAESDPDFTAWAALALAAAGINPQDQARPGGTDAYAYLLAHAAALEVTTDFDRALLVADAAGASPHEFGGVDLVRALLERQLPSGAFPHQIGDRSAGVNDTEFAILALAPVEEPAAQSAVARAAAWLLEAQDGDGSWPSSCDQSVGEGCSSPGGQAQGEVDATAAAVEALSATRTGVASAALDTPIAAAEQKAFEYLHTTQDPDGGFPEYVGEPQSNAASTAWAIQAIWSDGGDPQAWVDGGSDPLRFLASLQQPDGSVSWKVGDDTNPVWMTAFVLPALSGRYLPYAAVARAPTLTPSPPVPATVGSAGSSTGSDSGAGHAGESPQRGSGVIAGGGGEGAPLFSRPQRQSRGVTPGGGRRLRQLGRHSRAEHDAVGWKPMVQVHPEPNVSTHSTTTQGNTSTAARASGSYGDQAPVVKGVLIAAPSGRESSASEPAAPGLHAAGSGGTGSAWPAVAITCTLALLVAAGVQLERRRPQEVL